MKTLKKAAMLSLIIFASCEKFDKHEEEPRTCACVNNESVPENVRTSFTSRYPQNSPEKWFNKDDKGLVALFTKDNSRTLVQFNNDGSFKTENVVPADNSNVQPDQPGKPPCKSGHKPPKPRKPFFSFKPHKQKGNCDRPRPETECQVHLEN
jgi:hypothetical protein